MQSGKRWLRWGGLGLGLLATASIAYLTLSSPDTPTPPPSTPPQTVGVEKELLGFCGACHANPNPNSFPRSAWKSQVEKMYALYEKSGLPLRPPLLEYAVRYYEERSPEQLPPLQLPVVLRPCPAQWQTLSTPRAPNPDTPAVANVQIVHLTGDTRPQVLASDMRTGAVMALFPQDDNPSWRILAQLGAPARANVVDLDGDGIKDLLVAELGNFLPTDRRCGKVIWLRGSTEGRFTPQVLADNLGRVADVRAADFRGTGALDLVVASFGYQRTGELILLENHTSDWKKPDFRPKVLDQRHGAIHVPILDWNKDGRPDFITVFAQEHECVVAYLNEGNGRFRAETVHAANDPGYGSSGIELVDMDNDGDLDVLYTNGDVLDQPYLLKPYHSVQWLENEGRFPFKHHAIGPMYGVHNATAADVDNDGDQDVVAVSFLPGNEFAERKPKKLDAITLFEQVSPGRFERHGLESVNCDHVSVAAGDLWGTGRVDLVIGGYGAPGAPVTIWRSQPSATSRAPRK